MRNARRGSPQLARDPAPLEPGYVGGLPAGFLLQEYRIERVLGHGGFGVTYLAHDTSLQKHVAVKEFLPTEWATRGEGHAVSVRSAGDRPAFEAGLSSFLNEARVLARFKHPNLITVHRFFQANDTAYIVMEYAAGRTLKSVIKKAGSLPEARVKELLRPVLGGLQLVHKAGILHRDIKPENVLVRDDDGTAVLIDFGAARYAMGAKSRTMTSVLTPGYAPIEQYSPGSKQGPYTDVYALGAVMYYAIAGHKPIDAAARTHDDPLVPAAVAGVGRYSAGFLEAVDWALRVRPEQRPQSIADWREVLDGARPAPAPAVSTAAPLVTGGDTTVNVDGTATAPAADLPPPVDLSSADALDAVAPRAAIRRKTAVYGATLAATIFLLVAAAAWRLRTPGPGDPKAPPAPGLPVVRAVGENLKLEETLRVAPGGDAAARTQTPKRGTPRVHASRTSSAAQPAHQKFAAALDTSAMQPAPVRDAVLDARYDAFLAGDAGTPPLRTDAEEFSYAVGFDFGESLRPVSGLDLAKLRRAVVDGLQGRSPALKGEDRKDVKQRVSEAVLRKQAVTLADAEAFSVATGFDLGRSLKQIEARLDLPALRYGMQDALGGVSARLNRAQRDRVKAQVATDLLPSAPIN